MNARHDLPSLQLAGRRLVDAAAMLAEVHAALRVARAEFEEAELAVVNLLCGGRARGNVIVCGDKALVCDTENDPWESPPGARVRIEPLAAMVDATPPEPCEVDAAGTYLGEAPL